MPRSFNTAVIIGAGMHGCAVAISLAKAGWRVAILEKNLAGRHASGVNAGGLRLLHRDWREYPLSVMALEYWSKIEKLVGEDAAKRCEVRLGVGQIAVALDEAEMSWTEERAKEMDRRGLGKEEILSRDEIRRLLPGIADKALGGQISRQDGHSNPASSARAFRDAATGAGATLHENCKVLGLDRSAGGGWKVETSRGSFQGDILVNCAGAWGSRVAAMADEILPEKIMAPSMMVTARVKPFLKPVVIGIDRPLSFKQSAAGSLVIGGGILGEALPDQDRSFTVMDRMTQSAAAVVEAFPDLKHVPVLRTWTGLEGGTPDGVPMIGPGATHADIWHSFGYCGHGYLLAPAVGEVVARSLINGVTDALLAPFSPDRFAVPFAKQPREAVQ